VYRFVRRNDDVLYVGKATSLKKRVASHFKSRGPSTERALELLTQVHDVQHTETASLLEAALLECDEIKRFEPPYNVQLRSNDRSAWFASRDLAEAAPTADAEHPLGPLPSERALSGLHALSLLSGGAAATPLLRARALGVPLDFLPPTAMFDEGFASFVEQRLGATAARPLQRVLSGARALWFARGRVEPDAEIAEELPPDSWDLARVRRRLERNLVQGGLVFRRARWLALLVDAAVAFREPGALVARVLVFSSGQLRERHELAQLALLTDIAAPPLRPRSERKRSFDAATYDRLRVLITELRRVHDSGGEVALRLGKRTLAGSQLSNLLRSI
jgi:hypothetical protein